MIEIGNSELISVYLYAYKQTSLEQVIFLRSSVQYISRLLSYDSANHYYTVVTRKYSVLLLEY